MQGYIDDFRYYNRILNASEVAQLYQYNGIVNPQKTIVSSSVNLNWSTINTRKAVYGFMSCYGNYMYFPNYANNQVIKIDLTTGGFGTPILTTTKPFCCLAYNEYLYVFCEGGVVISQYDLNGNLVNANWCTISNVWNMCTDGTYIYAVINGNGNPITQINLSDGSIANSRWANTSNAYHAVINGNYLYFISGNNYGTSVEIVNLSTQTIINTNFIFSTSGCRYISIYGNYIYLNNLPPDEKSMLFYISRIL